jgi:hypothetical protein
LPSSQILSTDYGQLSSAILLSALGTRNSYSSELGTMIWCLKLSHCG